MTLTERRHDTPAWMPQGLPGGESSGDAGVLDAAREAGERFLRAGDRAIDRALSGDSERFLRQSRQEGGQ